MPNPHEKPGVWRTWREALCALVPGCTVAALVYLAMAGCTRAVGLL